MFEEAGKALTLSSLDHQKILRAMNISPKMLYPGLEGIGKSLSQYLPLIDE